MALLACSSLACGAQVEASDGGTQTRDGSSTFGPSGSDAGGANASDAAEESGLPPADGFINVAVVGGSACTAYPSLVELVRIGTAAAGHPNTVEDGGQYANNDVAISCTVHPDGDGFDLALFANERGPQYDGLWFTSQRGLPVTTMPTSHVAAYFTSSTSGVAFSAGANENDVVGCTITYEYDPGGSFGGVAGDVPVPVGPPIAAGRIWGHIKCPNAFDTAMPSVVCDIEGDFMFENCRQ